jgi:hypothetical protein
VLDFGLAKMMPADNPESAAQPTALATVTGHFVGTPAWASPEQAARAPSLIDIRTDVYSLGLILYHMLTGRFPYNVTGDWRDVLDRIQQAQPVRPRALGIAIGDEVEAIVLKCLAKERERRYQSAGELARDIGHYLSGKPIEAKRDSVLYLLRKHLRRHRARVAIAASFVVVLTLGLASSLTFWQHAERQRAVAVSEAAAADAARRAEDAQRELSRLEQQRSADLQRQAERRRAEQDVIGDLLLAMLRRAGARSADERTRGASELLDASLSTLGAKLTERPC